MEKERWKSIGVARTLVHFLFLPCFFTVKSHWGFFVLVGDLVTCDVADQSCTAASKLQ